MIVNGFDLESGRFIATVMKNNKTTRELAVYIPKLMSALSGENILDYTIITNTNSHIPPTKSYSSGTVHKVNYIWARAWDMDTPLPEPKSKVEIIFLDGNFQTPYWRKFNVNKDYSIIPEERYPTLVTLQLNDSEHSQYIDVTTSDRVVFNLSENILVNIDTSNEKEYILNFSEKYSLTELSNTLEYLQNQINNLSSRVISQDSLLISNISLDSVYNQNTKVLLNNFKTSSINNINNSKDIISADNYTEFSKNMLNYCINIDNIYKNILTNFNNSDTKAKEYFNNLNITENSITEEYSNIISDLLSITDSNTLETTYNNYSYYKDTINITIDLYYTEESTTEYPIFSKINYPDISTDNFVFNGVYSVKYLNSWNNYSEYAIKDTRITPKLFGLAILKDNFEYDGDDVISAELTIYNHNNENIILYRKEVLTYNISSQDMSSDSDIDNLYKNSSTEYEEFDGNTQQLLNDINSAGTVTFGNNSSVSQEYYYKLVGDVSGEFEIHITGDLKTQ